MFRKPPELPAVDLELFEFVSNYGEKIKSELSFSTRKDLELESFWVPFSDSSLEEPEGTLSAVDGSRNYKAFVGFLVYAVAATALFYRNGRLSDDYFHLPFVGVLKPEEFSDARLRILMGILELRAALSAGRKSDYLLIDGSFLGTVLRPTVFLHDPDPRLREEVERLFLEERPSLPPQDGEIISAELYKKVFSLTTQPQEAAAAAGYLEYLEYLSAAAELYGSCRQKLVAVAKRSNSRDYSLHPLLPDAAVLNHLPLPPGYSLPKLKRGIEGADKFKFPDLFNKKGGPLRNLELNTFFLKLSPSGQVLKVETGLEPEEAVRVLRAYSYEDRGYPIPLEHAHHSVKINKDVMERIVQELQIDAFTGREGLGE